MSCNTLRPRTPLLMLLALAALTIGCQNKPPAPLGDNLQSPCASDRTASSATASLNQPPAPLGDNLQSPCASDTAALIAAQYETQPLPPPTTTQPQPPARRDWPQRIRYFHNVAVVHPQHYLQGPCETLPEDGVFRTWDWQSLLALPASPTIFLSNTILWPIDLAFHPIWHAQASRAGLDPAEPTYALPACDSEATRNEPWRFNKIPQQTMVMTQPQ